MNFRAHAIHSFIAFMLLVAVVWTGSPCHAIVVSGDVSGTWTLDLSPVVVTEDCRIPAGETLMVAPGVRILMAPGSSVLVEGELQTLGTPQQPVSFLPAAPLVGPWKAIAISQTGLAVLNHCVVRGGGAAQPTELMGALTVQGGTLTVRHCSISASDSNGIYIRAGTLTVESVHFDDNGGARPTDAGIHIASGVVTFASGTEVTSINGSPFGVYNEDLVPVYANGVWWGSATGPQHASNILGLGVSVSDDVRYDGYATASPDPVPGDVNMDGELDLRDVAALVRIVAGFETAARPQIHAGDLNIDGSLDITDAVALAVAVLSERP